MSIKKFLIIGSKDFNVQKEDYKITSVGWQNLEQIKNIKDYDNLILNLKEFQNIDVVDSINYEIYSNLFNFKNISEILFNKGEIVLFGDSRFKIKIDDHNTELFLKWTGFGFGWDNNQGDTIEYDDYYFLEYLNKINKWDYSLERSFVNATVLEEAYDLDKFKTKGIKTKFKRVDYVTNRFKNPILFSIKHQFIHETRRLDEVVQESGNILILPQADLSLQDTIHYIMKYVFKTVLTEEPPKWLAELKVPGQIEIEQELETTKDELKQLSRKKTGYEEKINELREITKLLYECDNSLKPVV